ncbi:MAG: STAS domain-containing protein [Acidobacteriaceae bacterium]|nr:STAS domain-containing protein [Acidobacteriaceae bacterium]
MAAPLAIKPRIEDGIAILELSGTLTLGPSLVGLRNNARQILGKNVHGLIVELAAIRQMDSSGLSELTVVYTLAMLKRCPLRLVNPNDDLCKILAVTRLDGILPIAADIESAKTEIRQKRAKPASSPG